MTLAAVRPVNDVKAADVIYLVLDRLNASSSKVVYARALREFLAWYQLEPGARFDKATVQRYRTKLIEDGARPSSINQRLCAIRAPGQEAADNHLIDAQLNGNCGLVVSVAAPYLTTTAVTAIAPLVSSSPQPSIRLEWLTVGVRHVCWRTVRGCPVPATGSGP